MDTNDSKLIWKSINWKGQVESDEREHPTDAEQFKEIGNRMVCNKYRGIIIMDTLAKIYDVMILNRLKLWCSIDIR